jgi:propanol-preferring alcohol dehydrogenase
MKAWQFTGTGEPLVLNDVSEPIPGPGHVVLDVKAAGLCHSDSGIMHDPHQIGMAAKLPITLGHEIAGIVSAVGDDVTEWKIGDRVGICPTAFMAAGGPYAGEATPGYGHDGGFAEKYMGPAYELVRIPDGLDIALGAVATDAGMTSYHALVRRGGCQPGMKVGIIGMGGLGQIATRVAVLIGAEVHVAETKKDVWPLAEEMGVTEVVSDASEWAGQGFDLIVDYAGFGTTTAAALEALRFDGTVVQVGAGKLAGVELNMAPLILNHLNLLGSVGGTKEDIGELYELMANKGLKPVITEIKFDEIPEGIDRLTQGTVTGRLVARVGD